MLYCILQSELYVFVVAEAIKHSVSIELDKLCSILCIGEERSTHILSLLEKVDQQCCSPSQQLSNFTLILFLPFYISVYCARVILPSMT